MAYLTPTSARRGALRVIPGSHLPALHRVLEPLQRCHAGVSRKLLGWPAAVALGAGSAVGLMIGNAAGVLDGPVFRDVLRQGTLGLGGRGDLALGALGASMSVGAVAGAAASLWLLDAAGRRPSLLCAACALLAGNLLG